MEAIIQRRRQIIQQEMGGNIQFYDGLPLHHRLSYWDQHYKHRNWGLDLPR